MEGLEAGHPDAAEDGHEAEGDALENGDFVEEHVDAGDDGSAEEEDDVELVFEGRGHAEVVDDGFEAVGEFVGVEDFLVGVDELEGADWDEDDADEADYAE